MSGELAGWIVLAIGLTVMGWFLIRNT